MTEPTPRTEADHPDSVFAVHEIVPFLRSMVRSGETLHQGDINGIEKALAQARTEALDVEALARAVVAEATCERWGDLHSIRWASDTFAACVVERYRGTLPPEFDCQPAKATP